MNSFLMGPSDYSGLHPADALSLVSVKTDGSTAHVEGKMSETEFTKFLNDNGIN